MEENATVWNVFYFSTSSGTSSEIPDGYDLKSRIPQEEESPLIVDWEMVNLFPQKQAMVRP